MGTVSLRMGGLLKPGSDAATPDLTGQYGA